MTEHFHVLAACSNRKRAEPISALRFREVRGLPADAKVREWVRRLRDEGAATLAAERLYVGPYWSDVLRLVDSLRKAGHTADLWILSAGYGLLHASEPVQPYSATFAKTHADTVIDGNGSRDPKGAAWWGALNHLRSTDGQPRGHGTLTQIAERRPKASVVVMASASYLRAIESELLELKGHLKSASSLAVLTGRDFAVDPKLGDNVISVSAGLAGATGGSLTSLHARTGQLLLNQTGFRPVEVGAWREAMRRAQAETPPRTRPTRTQITDSDVRTYIATELKRAPSTSATALLRALRDTGLACEQKRFRDLYHEVRGDRQA